jgi:uncharacterized lipoprotein YbaY
MAKKRKTRQEKIIRQLRQKLAQEAPGQIRQEPVSYRISTESKKIQPSEKTDKPDLSFNPKLIKRDLIKTLALSLAIISLEAVLYFKLR